MRTFLITLRTSIGSEQFTHIAESAGRAAEDVAGMVYEPCGITVVEEAR